MHVAGDAHALLFDDLKYLPGGVTELLVAIGRRRVGAVFPVHPLQVGQDLAGRAEELALVLELGPAAGQRLVLDLHSLHAELGFPNVAEGLLDLGR